MLETLLLLALVTPADERALAVETEMVEALGGRTNWDEARFIRFTFVRGDREPQFTWDRWTGRLRVESRDASGVPYVVLMNIKTKQGKALLEGRPLRGAELSEYLNRTYAMWKGETYWFLMPFKWRDEGVVLAHEGEETVDDVVYDKIQVTFADADASPGDIYLAYVNRETRRMDRWTFTLASGFEGDYLWRRWHRHGGLLLATERAGNDEVIRFENIYIGTTIPDALFTSPEPLEFP